MSFTRALAALVAVVLTAAPAVAQAPDPLDLVKEGRKLNAAGKQDEALALYERALKLNPKLFDGHLAAGIVLDLKGEYARARTHLQRAIDLARDEAKPQALSAMAVSYAFEAKATESEKYYQQQFDLQRRANAFDAAAATANAAGRAFLECGDIENAAKWYGRAHDTVKELKDLPPDQVDLWELRYQHALSRIAARRGQADVAARHAAAVKALVDKGGPNAEQLPAYQYLVGYIALYDKRYPDAVAALLKADQNDPFILGLLAQAVEAAGNAAVAREYYTKVLASNAHNLQNAFARPLARRKLGVQTAG